MVQAAPHGLVRVANAVVMGGLAGCLFTLLGTSLGGAVVEGLALGGAVYACTTVLKGRGVLAKVDATFAAFIGLYAAMGYGVIALMEGDGRWPSVWFMMTMTILIILQSPAVAARLRLTSGTMT